MNDDTTPQRDLGDLMAETDEKVGKPIWDFAIRHTNKEHADAIKKAVIQDIAKKIAVSPRKKA